MRKLGIAIVAVIVVIVLVLAFAPSFVDVNSYRPRIQAELEKRLNRPVTLGQIHLRLLPPSFQVADITIGEDPQFGSSQPFAQAQELDVTAQLMPLLHKEVAISSLELRQPHIELVRNQQGVWNFSSLGHNAPAQQPQQQPEQFALDNLKITDGQIALTDLQKHQSRAVYDHIDLALKNFAPGKPFDIDAAAHLPGSGAQVVMLNGTGGPINSGTLMDTPFDGKLKLQQVSLDAAQKFLNTKALANMNASISGEATVKNEKGSMASAGSLKIENAHINNVNVDYPITADYNVTDNLATDVINVQKGDIKLGSTPLSIAGTVDTKPTPSQLDLHLTASDASISEAARLASAFGVAFNPGMKIDGRVTANIQARGPANQPAMNGTLGVRNLAISGKDLPAPVQVSALDLALTPQTITSNDFSAITGGTTLGVKFSLAQYTTPDPNVDATIRANNANIGELLNIARAYGVTAVEGVKGSGTLSLNVRATGPVKNPNALAFNGNGQMQNAEVQPQGWTKPLQVKNATLAFTQNSANLSNLSASLGSTNATGNATVRNFAAPNVQFTLVADKADVSELQAITGASNAQPAKRAQVFWQLTPQADAADMAPAAKPGAPPSIVDKMTGNGTLAVANVLYDQLALTNLKSNVAIDHGLIKMSPVSAQLFGGQENGAITVDMRRTPMAVTVASKLSQVDANKLLSSTTSLKNTLYGLLAANADTSFTATSAADIAKTLNGTLSLDLVNGKLANIDLLSELASVGKFLQSGKQAQPFTNLVKLSGGFDVRNGVAQTNNLNAVIDGGTLAAAGIVNLVDQSLNMHLTAVLSKGMSQTVGGTGIGGFMQTALANRNGELVIPVIVTGTFQHPSFAPDVQKIAQMKMNNLLPSLNNPGQLSTGILGALTGKNPLGQGQNQGIPQGDLGGILGALGGNKQQQQQQQNQAQPQQQNQPQDNNPLNQALGDIFGKKKKQQPQQQQPPK